MNKKSKKIATKKASTSRPAKKAKKAAPKTEHRPRVRIRGSLALLGKTSPYKGRVTRINPGPQILSKPLRIELSAAESRQVDQEGPSRAFVSQVVALARKHGGGWDHIEVHHAGGRHAFDVVP